MFIEFKNSIIKYIAQYYVELNGKVDFLIFTAGVGENNIEFRKDIIKALEYLGRKDLIEGIKNGSIKIGWEHC